MSNEREQAEALAAAIAEPLAQGNFIGWLLDNPNSSLWTERTVEQEVGRVIADVVLESDWLAKHDTEIKAVARAEELASLAEFRGGDWLAEVKMRLARLARIARSTP